MNCTDSNISILIVEDYTVVRWAIKGFLEKNGFHIVGETSTSEKAVSLAIFLKPDVVLMNLHLNQNCDIEATRQISRDKNINVLAFSAYETKDIVDSFLRAGGKGFVSKLANIDELPKAIKVVAQQRRWISPRVLEIASNSPVDDDLVLSSREREIVNLVARGLSSSQIAERLYVSKKTIETHRYRIFKKLGITNRAQLVEYAITHGLGAYQTYAAS